MKLTLSQTRDNPRQLARRLGYAEFRDPNTGQTSYVRRLSANFYPRYCYLEKKIYLTGKRLSHKRCHFHFISQLQVNRGRWKQLPDQNFREQIYQTARKMLTAKYKINAYKE